MEQHIGWLAYDTDGPIGPDYDSPTRTNMIYDAAARPGAKETTGFVYDSVGPRAQPDEPIGFVYDRACAPVFHEGPGGFIYEGVRYGHAYDTGKPEIRVMNDPGPVADEPTIIERKPGDAEGREP